MGYTHGRKRDLEFLRKEALRYKTRSEFAKADCSLYAYAARHGLLDHVRAHMCKIRGGFSVPQYICKIIFDDILEDIGEYNTRKVITPFEIDIFYPKFNLAIEYNGRRWHTDLISDRKRKKLESRKLHLMVIEQGNCPSFFQNYVPWIKNDIISKLDEINRICGKTITPEKVNNVKIDYYDIPFNIDWKEIETVARSCNSKMELYKKNDRFYRLLLRHNKTEILTELENRLNTDIKIKRAERVKNKLEFIKNNFTDYKSVRKDNKLYGFLKNHKLTQEVRRMFIPQE